VLALAGLIVSEGPGERPEYDAPPRLMLDYFGDQDMVVLGGFLLALAALAALWFTGWLRATLRTAEGGSGRLSATAFAGGVTCATFMLAWPAAGILGALYAERLSPEQAQTIFLLGNMFLYPAAMAAAVLVAATAIIALRTAVLPRWHAFASLVLAVWLLIPPFGLAGGNPENPALWTGLAALATIPLWTAITAVTHMLTRREP
jgi:hypothetical protein